MKPYLGAAIAAAVMMAMAWPKGAHAHGDGCHSKLPLVCRAAADPRTLRAACDWTREGPGWTSANGWKVRRAHIGSEPDGWAAFAPDGVPEWWAADPVTAMVRAEGGS